jgi:2-methylisocitrate lyase-like PEP mutase family enzyme
MSIVQQTNRALKRELESMNSADRARRFAALHVKGHPLVLTNIWDAGSAKAVTDAGASAIATSSWSMAAAQGFADGEKIPLDLVEGIVSRIAKTVDVPLTVDFEGGYAIEPETVADNVERIVSAGAIGINFEDGVINENAIYDIPFQCRRIRAIRTRAERIGTEVFINARTDLFLQAGERNRHVKLLDTAIERARAYAEAGASGFFAPGLVDERLIKALCAATELPVNIMITDDAPSTVRLGELGVSRISCGPIPFIRCMLHLKQQASSGS